MGGILSTLLLLMIMKGRARDTEVDERAYNQEGQTANGSVLLRRIIIMPLSFLYILFWFLTTAGVARTFGEVVVTAVLIRTPLEVIVATMLLVAFFMVMYDVEVMARVNEALLLILIIPLLFIALLAFQSADFMRLLPLISVDWMSLVKGMLAASFAFLGYELVALFKGHINAEEKSTRRAAMVGMLIPLLVYVLIVIAGISSFGYEELQRLMWPTLELVKTTEMPGLILERLESAFLGVWVAAVFTTVANLYFSACYAAKKTFHLKTHRWLAFLALPAIYYLAMWPDSVHHLFAYLQTISYVGLGLNITIALLMYLSSLFRSKS